MQKYYQDLEDYQLKADQANKLHKLANKKREEALTDRYNRFMTETRDGFNQQPTEPLDLSFLKSENKPAIPAKKADNRNLAQRLYEDIGNLISNTTEDLLSFIDSLPALNIFFLTLTGLIIAFAMPLWKRLNHQ